MKEVNVWILVPFYNQSLEVFLHLMDSLRSTGIPIVVVDDGSNKPLEGVGEGARIIRHEVNKGKGAAIRTGSEFIISKGGTHIITIDGDGQHRPKYISTLLEILKDESSREEIIICSRIFPAEGVPMLSRIGRAVSNFLVKLETGVYISDSQSGFRLYPAAVFERVSACGNAFVYETELLVKALRAGFKLRELSADVLYPKDRISHFRRIRHTLEFIPLHLSLFAQSFFLPRRRL